MAFERLQNLGKDKFARICNELARGTPAMMVARLIHEWGDARDVREDTLSKQLKRLGTAITNSAFGGDLAQLARDTASVRIKLFHGSTLNCLDELNTIANVQEARINRLIEKERASSTRIVGLNKIINDYKTLLISIQKIRFDLGLDEYRRGFPPVTPATSNATLPDETTKKAQLLEAVLLMEEVFERRALRSK
jgi:hypothetical protein